MISLETRITALPLVAPVLEWLLKIKEHEGQRDSPSWSENRHVIAQLEPGEERKDRRRGKRGQVILKNHNLLSFLQMSSTE